MTLLERQQPVASSAATIIEQPNQNHIKALQRIQSIAAKELGAETSRAVVRTPGTTTEQKPIVGGALRMLHVLASRYPMTFTKSQLALLATLSPKSGTYGTYVSALKSQGLIEVGSEVAITQAGMGYLGAEKPAPQTQQEILALWHNHLTGGAQRMFDALVSVYPEPISKEELGQRTAMSSVSGTFGTYLSLLRRTGLVATDGNAVRASPNLFVMTNQ